jgi:NAD-reducing hydrogenase large subunit
MAERVVIDPVTRIEGHAKISLFLDDSGRVSEARFHVAEFRGFEKFCEGRSFREMPAITSRVCGICPVSHLLASAKAGDGLLAVQPPPAAVNLRRLMNLGQIIQSHALSFFHLSGPDLVLGFGSDPAARNLMGLIRQRPDFARCGIRLRKFGQELIEALGGKRIHSAWAVPGGVTDSFSDEAEQKIRAGLSQAEADILTTLAEFKPSLPDFRDEIESFGNFPSLFLGLVTPEGDWEHHDGVLRVCDLEGKVVADRLDPDHYMDFLGEAVEPWSYLKSPYFKPLSYPAGMYRVGPLARLNLAERFGTPKADAELAEFRQRHGRIAVSSFLYHHARLVEILGAIEQIARLLEDPLTRDPCVRAVAELNRTEAVGLSEAPRGTLFHHYQVDEQGLLKRVNLIIATGQNNLAMNQAIRQIADRYVHGNVLNDEMLNRVEAGIRAFDPCLSCSTHALGRMPLHVRLIGPAGELLSERYRGSDGT